MPITVTGGSTSNGQPTVAGNVYSATGMGSMVTTSGNTAVVFSGSDPDSGSNETVNAGDGNTTVSGLTGGADVTLGSGDSKVFASGKTNSFHIGSGQSSIYAYQPDSTGSNSGNSITADDGNYFVGLGGTADTVSVGSGTIQIVGSTGYASITAGTGVGDITANNIVANDGYNYISVGGGNHTIVTGNQDTTASGTSGNSTVVAGAGSTNITLYGLGNQASLTGGSDTVTTAPDSVAGTGGSDTISITGTALSIAGAMGTSVSVFVNASSANSSIIDNGTGTQVTLVGGGAGTLTFDPSNDSSWSFDLTNAGPGINSVADLSSHLSYDAAADGGLGASTLNLPNGTSVVFDKVDLTQPGATSHIKLG